MTEFAKFNAEGSTLVQPSTILDEAERLATFSAKEISFFWEGSPTVTISLESGEVDLHGGNVSEAAQTFWRAITAAFPEIKEHIKSA